MTSPIDTTLERVARAIYAKRIEGHVIRRVGVVAETLDFELARAALDASGKDELEWLDAHKSMELTWGELDGDMSECAWRVHRVNGGYNDREWTLIATGETAREAIRAAIARTQERS